MSLIANGAGEQPTGFYNGVATTSLRFNPADDAYLTREFDAPSNNKKWTYSTWLKRSKLAAHQAIISSNVDGSNYFDFRFSNTDILYVQNRVGGSNLIAHGTTSVFRDTSAWYNIVLIYDSDNSTAANRTLVYVNGVKHTLTSVAGDGDASYFNLDGINHNFGASRTADSSGTVWSEFGGYVSEVNFCDGQAYAPTNFGETKNGVWIPKNTSGLTFGNNGFRIRHNQVGVGTASTSTIGADTSGNTNHLTSVNIVASDCAMPDSPENNFCTWNPLTIGAQGVLAEGNLKNVSFWSADLSGNASTFFPESGKWYWETRIDGASAYPYIGITSQEKVNDTVNGGTFYSIAWRVNGTGESSGSSLGNITKENIPSFADDDILSFALDVDARKLWVAENNTYADSGNPANGSGENASWTLDVGVSPFMMGYNGHGDGTTTNFGQDDTFAGAISSAGNTDGNGIGVFKYAPPSGFLALCTANLPEPTIGPNSDTQSDDHFNTVLYTGNGVNSATGQDISGVGFKPDWLWIKRRNATASHNLRDSTRGVLKHLQSDNGDAEDTESDVGVTAFLDDGFRLLGTNAGTGQVNANNGTYVAWNWKANGGTTSSNSNGSITSTVQANTTAGFSIVTYTGTGANATIGHGLSKALDVVLVKGRDNDDRFWNYWGTQFVNTSYIYLNVPAGEDTGGASITNSTYPTNSVFSVGTSTFVCGSSEKYVAYCFHEVEGYSKFGSYIGTGVADGASAFTGFRPAFLMVKNIGASHHWWMSDSKRPGFNGVLNTSGNARVRPSTTGGEDDPGRVDFLSNGFKIKTPNYGESNTDNIEYIYMAFAEAPFKYSNAR